MIDCLFINPPFNRIPIDYLDDASLSRFKMDAINPGIMSMASYLLYKGMSIEIVDLYRESDWDSIENSILDSIDIFKPRVIAISNMSSYDYLDCLSIVKMIKYLDSESKVVLGGQHASGLKDTVFIDCPELEYIVEGEGEYAIYDFINAIKNERSINKVGNLWTKINKNISHPNKKYKPFDLNRLPPIDFSIYPNAISFTPYIEESRGCPFKCQYCNNKSFYDSKVSVKSVEKFNADLQSTVGFFGEDKLYAILASDFNYNTAIDHSSSLEKYNIRWSSQMDCIHNWADKIYSFKKSGMFLLNIGLESGSTKTLFEMGKTKNAKTYLNNCVKTLNRCKEAEINTRINILLYPNDDYNTLQETYEFLNTISNYLDAVVCCPTIAYPGSYLYNHLNDYKKKYGTKPIESKYCRDTHHFPLHLNSIIDYYKATNIAIEIEKKYSQKRILSTKHNYKEYEGILL